METSSFGPVRPGSLAVPRRYGRRGPAGIGGIAVFRFTEAVAESRGGRVSRKRLWWGLRRGSCPGVVSLATADQAVASAVVCRQSLSMLWAAVARRHSDRAADLPRRKKRSMRRLNFVSANTGSIIVWRLA